MAEKFIDLTKLATEDESTDFQSQETVPRRAVTPDSGGVTVSDPNDLSMAWTPDTVIKENLNIVEDPAGAPEPYHKEESTDSFYTHEESERPDVDHWMDSIATTDFVATEVGAKSNRYSFYLVLLFVGVIAGYFIWENQLLWQEDLAVVSVVPSNKKVKNNDGQIKSLAANGYRDINDIENPYWDLPNPIPVAKKKLSRWTQAEMNQWSEGIAHRYAFQRFHTIDEVRRYRLKGSEEILFLGLKDKKFWTRMRSLIGLVEFGVPVDVDVVESAMDGARSSLVTNYFKRFQNKMTDAESYILRQAIKVAGIKTRRSIITSLAKHTDHYQKLYLAAALYDPDLKVQGVAKSAFIKLGLKGKEIKSYDKFITGRSAYPVSNPDVVTKEQSAPTITAKKVSETEFSGKIKYYNDALDADSIEVIEIR